MISLHTYIVFTFEYRHYNGLDHVADVYLTLFAEGEVNIIQQY